MSNGISQVEIDAICIDLGLVLRDDGEPRDCNHFTIRGYAADMRQRDGGNSLRIGDGSSSCTIEQLPPIDVPRFRHWRCYSCLRGSGISMESSPPQHSGEDALRPSGEGPSGQPQVNEPVSAGNVASEANDIPARLAVQEEGNFAAEVNVPAPDLEEGNAPNGEGEGVAEDAAIQPMQLQQQNEEPNGPPRRKARKVRLLQDLLCGKKASAKRRRKLTSCHGVRTSRTAPSSSAVQPKRKTNEEPRSSEVSSPSFIGKKLKALKGDGLSKTPVVEESEPAAVSSGPGNKHGIQATSMANKSSCDQAKELRLLFNQMGGAEKLLSAAICAKKSLDLQKSGASDAQATLLPPTHLQKQAEVSKKKDPQSHHLSVDTLMKRKDVGFAAVRDRSSDTELGLGLSLVHDPHVEARTSVLPALGKGINGQSRKPGFLLGESSTAHGNASDLPWKNRNTPRQAQAAPLQEQRQHYPQLSQHQKLDFSDPHNKRSGGLRGYSDVMRAHQRQENIFSHERPDEMEVVELMAKNQYERNLSEAESRSLPGRSHNKGIPNASGFLKANRNERIAWPPNQEYPNMRTLPPSNSPLTNVPTSESAVPIVRNSVSFLRKQQMPSFIFDAFPHGQQQSSGAMRFSDVAAQRHRELRFHEANGSKTAALQSAPGSIDAYKYRNGMRHREAVGNTWSSAPRTLPFGGNVEMHAKGSEKYKGKNIIDLDLNVMAPNVVEEQNKNSDLESLDKRASSEYQPSHAKDKRVEPNRNHMISLDSSYSNEAIPAMQLLSLMDAGKSSSPFSMDGRRFLPRPFSPCYEHRSSTIAGKPSSSRNPHFSYSGLRPATPQSIESSRNFLSASAPFPSLFQTDRNVRGPTGPGFFRPPQEKPPAVVSQIHSNRQEDPFVFPLPWHVNMGAQGAVDQRSCPSGTERCTTNLNPADFSVPGPENPYMINGKDLVLTLGRNFYNDKGKSIMGNADARKRQRIIKFTPEEPPQNQT